MVLSFHKICMVNEVMLFKISQVIGTGIPNIWMVSSIKDHLSRSYTFSWSILRVIFSCFPWNLLIEWIACCAIITLSWICLLGTKLVWLGKMSCGSTPVYNHFGENFISDITQTNWLIDSGCCTRTNGVLLISAQLHFPEHTSRIKLITEKPTRFHWCWKKIAWNPSEHFLRSHDEPLNCEITVAVSLFQWKDFIVKIHQHVFHFLLVRYPFTTIILESPNSISWDKCIGSPKI